jgi:hypothetical protein
MRRPIKEASHQDYEQEQHRETGTGSQDNMEDGRHDAFPGRATMEGGQGEAAQDPEIGPQDSEGQSKGPSDHREVGQEPQACSPCAHLQSFGFGDERHAEAPLLLQSAQ